MPEVLLFVVLILAGQPPAKHAEPMPDLQACLAAVEDILGKAVSEQMPNVQAGCVVTNPPKSST